MESTEQDKSEQPTSFKLDRARRDGSIARGMDLGFFAVLAALLLFGAFAGKAMGGAMIETARNALIMAPTVVGGAGELMTLGGALLGGLARPAAAFALLVFALVLLLELVQTGFVFTAKPLKPDFSRLNPAKGLKRLFTLRMLIETAKNVLKLSVYAAITWFVIRRVLTADAAAIDDAAGLGAAMAGTALRLVACFAGAALFFALFDQLIVRRDFLKKMRMSRREVRREMRDREGEPRLKQRRRQLHAEFAQAGESLRGVRGADVVVTNPTHIAVGLRYDRATMAAPVVVARGVSELALRIRKLAFLNGVVIVEHKPLARALHRQCALGSPVPESCYADVAAVYRALPARAEG